MKYFFSCEKVKDAIDKEVSKVTNEAHIQNMEVADHLVFLVEDNKIKITVRVQIVNRRTRRAQKRGVILRDKTGASVLLQEALETLHENNELAESIFPAGGDCSKLSHEELLRIIKSQRQLNNKASELLDNAEKWLSVVESDAPDITYEVDDTGGAKSLQYYTMQDFKNLCNNIVQHLVFDSPCGKDAILVEQNEFDCQYILDTGEEPPAGYWMIPLKDIIQSESSGASSPDGSKIRELCLDLMNLKAYTEI